MYPTYLYSSQPFASTLIPQSTQCLYPSHPSANTSSSLFYYPTSQNSTPSQPLSLSDSSSPQNIPNYSQCYQFQPTYIFPTPVLAMPGSFMGASLEFVNIPQDTEHAQEINPNENEKNVQIQEVEQIQTTNRRASTRASEVQQDIEDLEETQLMRPAIQRNSLKITKQRVPLPKLPAKAEKILKRWFMENYYDPYPNSIERLNLAKDCGLEITQVNNWFKKARKIQADIPCKFSIEIERRLLSQMQEQQ